jgi:long-subunit fatty acid transport protein
VNENFSIGVGLQYVLATATLENESSLAALPVPVPLPPLQTTIDADNGSGDVGFNVGVLWKNEKWGIGAQYRSGITLGFEGTADFTTPTTGIPQIDGLLAAAFRDQDGSTEIPIPDLVLAGIAFRPSPKAEIEFDVELGQLVGLRVIHDRFRQCIAAGQHQRAELG